MNICRICKNEIKDKYDICKNCWNEKEIIKESRYHLKNEYYIIDQYYDFFLNKDLDYKSIAHNMIALAEILDEKNYNPVLLDNVYQDITMINEYSNITTQLEDRYKQTKDLDEKEIIKNKLAILEFEIKHNECKNCYIEDYRKKYTAEHRCNDGHYVRSKNEQIIDNYLYRKKIFHEYEKPVYDKETKKQFALVDFFLPYDKGIYIEVFGKDTKKYTETKEYKETMYTKNKLKLISITIDDINHIEDKLDQELLEYINDLSKMDCSL